MISLFQEMVNLNSEMTYRLYTEKAEHFDKNWQMVFDSAPIYLVACIHVSTKFENRDVVFEPVIIFRVHFSYTRIKLGFSFAPLHSKIPQEIWLYCHRSRPHGGRDESFFSY